MIIEFNNKYRYKIFCYDYELTQKLLAGIYKRCYNRVVPYFFSIEDTSVRELIWNNIYGFIMVSHFIERFKK